MPDVETTTGVGRGRLRRAARSGAWAFGALALAAALLAVLLVAYRGQAPAGDGGGLTAEATRLLQYDPLPDATPAPSFTLTDQHGRSVSPGDFAGRSVVLSFDDDRCDDQCTLLAEDIRAADDDLGPAADDVVFLAVNVNPYHHGVADVRAWTEQQGLGSTRNWHFATGTPAQLKRVWRQYGIPVETHPHDRTVDHGTQVYFIGPHGTERAMGAFGTASADTALYGHALARAAVDLLPDADGTTVAGPVGTAPPTDGTGLGATPAPVELPRLDGAGSARLGGGGRLTVVNFWSRTCRACTRELPALERSRSDLGGAVSFVGVDVADDPADARRFAATEGVDYLLLSDRDGAQAARYAITGLPYTVILDGNGRVVVRHPGAFTTPQLDYVVQSLTVDDPRIR